LKHTMSKDTVGESLYVSDPKRLRSSSGHGGGWKTGVDFQHAGSFTHSATRLSCPCGRDPWGTRTISFVICPYSFPHHCMTHRLSVGTGLITNIFLLVIKTHEREDKQKGTSAPQAEPSWKPTMHLPFVSRVRGTGGILDISSRRLSLVRTNIVLLLAP
jgi:hypothetical protein